MPRPGYDPAARARLLQRKVKGERNRVFFVTFTSLSCTSPTFLIFRVKQILDLDHLIKSL